MQRCRDRLNGAMRAYNGREVSPKEMMSQHRLKEEALTRPRREGVIFNSEQQVPWPGSDMVLLRKGRPYGRGLADEDQRACCEMRLER